MWFQFNRKIFIRTRLCSKKINITTLSRIDNMSKGEYTDQILRNIKKMTKTEIKFVE